MRKQKQFTEEQKLQLLKSPYIEKVHSNHLEYTLEFKQLAITQYLQGKTPVEIFVNAHFDFTKIMDCFTVRLEDKKHYSLTTINAVISR